MQGKLRLDAFLSARTPRCSRARVQDSIRRGHVAVNGAVTTKTAAGVQPGDAIDLVVYEPAPIAAVPEVCCALYQMRARLVGGCLVNLANLAC